MGRLHIVINDKLEEKFRKNLGKKKGFSKKGDISKEIERLIKESLKKR